MDATAHNDDGLDGQSRPPTGDRYRRPSRIHADEIGGIWTGVSRRAVYRRAGHNPRGEPYRSMSPNRLDGTLSPSRSVLTGPVVVAALATSIAILHVAADL
jgi:hypothetical protein